MTALFLNPSDGDERIVKALFVPGRICLFGEHSDWAGGYRTENADLAVGQAILACTPQGLYAKVRPHPDHLIVHSTLPNGRRLDPCILPMKREVLQQEAKRGGFYSYAAGVAAQMLKTYPIQGAVIDNTRTDLPVKKGLSSSAAICVLVARAFGQLYNLNLTLEDELELAYQGERMTGSECGRMDQGCAFGQPIVMTFDGERIDVQRFSVGRPIHLLLVDLQASKDTRTILRALNDCYPNARTPQQQRVQDYLGPLNRQLCGRALQALEQGDAALVGAIMTEAQQVFDDHLQPVCPEQLTAPILHRTLACAELQPWIFGGKGVGAQGDGSAQFVVRDEEALEIVQRVLHEQFGMSCIPLVLSV